MIKKKKIQGNDVATRRLAQKEQVAVIWTRVSTVEQFNRNCSIANQQQACREYCRQHNIRVKYERGAQNESAKVAGRLFNEMVEEVSLDPEINRIIVYDYDRFSRNAAEGIYTKAQLKKNGILITAVNQPIDQSSFISGSMEDLMIVFANMENETRKHKCTGGMIACLERGEWYSKAPMGYDSTKIGKTHVITVNAVGEHLREAFMWKANENLSNTEIVARLQARGLNIHKQRLTEIFRNPFYCGKIQHRLLGDKVVEGKQEKLVSEEIFNKVQVVLSGNHDNYEHKKITPEFPLKKHVLCADDLRPWTGYIASKNKKGYYKCNVKGCGSNRSADEMHRKYADLLAQYIIPQPLKPVLESVLESKFKANNAKAYATCKTVSSKLAEIETKTKSIRKKYAFDEIDKETYDDAMEELLTRKATLDRELETVETELSNLDEYVSTAVEMSCKLGDMWRKFDFALCQKIQKMVFPEGVLFDKAIDDYRTSTENEVFGIFRKISADYMDLRKQKADNSVELSALVAGGGLEPPTFGL